MKLSKWRPWVSKQNNNSLVQLWDVNKLQVYRRCFHFLWETVLLKLERSRVRTLITPDTVGDIVIRTHKWTAAFHNFNYLFGSPFPTTVLRAATIMTTSSCLPFFILPKTLAVDNMTKNRMLFCSKFQETELSWWSDVNIHEVGLLVAFWMHSIDLYLFDFISPFCGGGKAPHN